MSMYFNFSTHKYVFYGYKVDIHCKCSNITKTYPGKINIAKHFNFRADAVAAKSLQSCLTLCDPIDGSPPGSPVPGSLMARTLEWVAVSSSNAWKWKVKVKSLSRVWLLVTPWTAAYQASLSMGFSRQEYWSGLPLPSLISELVNVNYIFSHELKAHNKIQVIFR